MRHLNLKSQEKNIKNKINSKQKYFEINFSTGKYRFNITRIDSWEWYKKLKIKSYKIMIKIKSKNVSDIRFIFKVY